MKITRIQTWQRRNLNRRVWFRTAGSARRFPLGNFIEFLGNLSTQSARDARPFSLLEILNSKQKPLLNRIQHDCNLRGLFYQHYSHNEAREQRHWQTLSQHSQLPYNADCQHFHRKSQNRKQWPSDELKSSNYYTCVCDVISF